MRILTSYLVARWTRLKYKVKKEDTDDERVSRKEQDGKL